MKIDDFLDSPTEQPKRAGGGRIDAFLDEAPTKGGRMDTFLDEPSLSAPASLESDAIYDPISGVQIAGSKAPANNSKSLLANSTLPENLRNLPGDKQILENIEKNQRATPGPQILNAQKWTPAEKRGTLRAIADSVLGLYQGATGMVKGVTDNINAGDNPVSNALQTVIDAEEKLKSGDLKEQQATRNMLIYGAKKSGEAAAARAAIQTLFDYPAAGTDVVARGTGSILPTIALGSLGAGTRVMGGVNALSNAGDAASQTADSLRALPLSAWANDPQYQELVSQGMDPQAAINLLIPIKAIGAQTVGGITGAASGFTGLERQLAGQVVGNTIKDRVKRAGSEILGEQAETLLPQITGNATVGAIDQKTKLLEGAGQAAVDTLAGTVPGAALAARRGNVAQAPAPSINPALNVPPAPLAGAESPSPIAPSPANAVTPDTPAPTPPQEQAAQVLSAMIARSAVPNSTMASNAASAPNLASEEAIDAFLDEGDTTGETDATPATLDVLAAPASVVSEPTQADELASTPATIEPSTLQKAQAAIAGTPVAPNAQPSTMQQAQAESNAPAYIDLDKHMQMPSAKPGIRAGDIVYKNGSVFKTKQAAKAVSKQAGKGWVIAPSNQGYVVRFRPQTEKQIAANAKRIAKQREVRPQTDSMLQAIAKLGGINSDELVKDWGVSLPDLNNKGSGVLRVATKNGMSVDRMADSLKELGYISQDENGKHDLAEMMDLFQEEARGGAKTYANTEDGGQIAQQYNQYQNDGYDEWIAAKEAAEAELHKLSEEAQTLIGEAVGEHYDRTQDEYAKLEQELIDWEQSGQSQDRLPAFNDQAIDASGRRLAQEAGEFDTNPAGEDRGDQGPTQTVEDPGQKQSAIRQTGTGSQRSSEEGFSLESQTQATLKAAEEAKQAAEKAKQAAERAADERAQADAQRNTFTLTGSDRSADVQAAQGQQDLLSSTPTTAKNDIKDFGQKIGGARKDVWNLYGDSLDASTQIDAAQAPLSKSWPEPNYEKLIESGADPKTVALMRAMRDSVPTKPKKSYKLKSWAEKVETLRSFANDLVKGTFPESQIEQLNQYSAIGGLADLYMAVGHSKSLANLRLSVGHYSVFEGKQYSPAKAIWSVEQTQANSNRRWPRQLVTADTKAEAIAKFKESFDTLMSASSEKKATEFVIYSRTSDKKFYVGKKVGRNYVDLAGGFDTSKEAREYRANNQEALVAKLEKFKETPKVRRDDNEPRVGEDMRNGEDVTPEYFGNTFGFKGVEFGNWVEQGKRQADLNEAFDALMDMAAVLGVPPKALSLNGELSLAFGARGKGGIDPAKAHYESNYVVINMTKKSGAGSLGHEWWHALDNYFSRMGKSPNDYMTSSTAVSLAARGSKYVGLDDVRREMVEAFGRVMKAIRESQLKSRSDKMDAKRSKEYWGTSIEMSARAFESYLIAKLQDQGASNDYLANIVSEQGWKANEALGAAEEGSYPYPTVDEMPAMRAAFDSFFQTVETETTDAGVRVFSSSVPQLIAKPLERSAISKIVAEAMKGFAHQAPVVLNNSVHEVFPSVDVSELTVNGATVNGRIHLFTDTFDSAVKVQSTLFHELFHYGLRRYLTRDQFITQMHKLYERDSDVKKYADNWVKTDQEGQRLQAEYGDRYAQARGVDEFLAFLSEPNQGKYLKTDAMSKLKVVLQRWLAQLAEFFGFKQYAADIRALKSEEARLFIQDIFSKLQRGEEQVANNFRDEQGPAYRLQDMESDLQDDMSLNTPDSQYVAMSPSDFAKVSKNALGHYQWSGGEKLYRNMTIVAKKYLGALKLADNKPAAFTNMLRQFRVDQLKANQTAKEIAMAGKELSPEQRVVLADLIEKNARAADIPTEDMVELAASVTTALEAQAQELVDLGMLSPDRLVKNYLPRLYKHGLSGALTNKDVFRSWFTKVRMKIRGNRLKSRGLFTEMATSRVALAKKLGWKVSSMTDGSDIPTDLFEAFDKSQPIPPNYRDTKVLMWRDYTEAERADMGEIRDGVLRYAMGYVDTQKDIAIGRLFKAIAGNSELAKNHNPGGWIKVPNSEIAGTGGVKQYGALSGMFVSPQVFDSLARNTQPKGVLIGMYDKALSFWKEGKTVWNPVSHGNNVISNLFTVHFAGVNPLNPLKWRETMREFKTKGTYWNEAVDNGLFGNEFANEEIQKLLMPDLSDMADMETIAASRMAKVIDLAKVTGKPLAYYREKMQHWYEFEDQFFKLMLYIDRRKQGLSPHDAITDAERYVFNYADIPEGIELIKRVPIGSPFFSYTYKAIPMVLHTAMTRPDRLLAPIALLGGANWLAYAFLGADEDKERKGMPEYLQGMTMIGTPKAVRMPWNDEGKPVFMDLSRRVPLGDLFDMTNKTNGLPIPAPFMPSHPVFSMVQAVLYNQDTYTGKDLVKKSDTEWEAAKARGAYLYRQFAPNAPMIPGSYNFNKLADAAAYTFDTEMGPYTGRTGAGDAIKPIPAALDVFTGTKIRAFDPARGLDLQDAAILKEVKEIKANVLSAQRNQSMSERSRQAYIAEQESKMAELEKRHNALRQ